MSIVALQDTFLQAYSRIPKSEQKKVHKLIDALRENRNSKGINLEHIKEAIDPFVYSARLSKAYRVILVKPEKEDVYLMVWVDHHDEAYRWAARKRFIPNKKTRTLQMWDLEEWEGKLETSRPVAEQTAPPLFAHVTDEQLWELGVVPEFIPIVRKIQTREDFKIFKPIFPKETVEYLEFIAQGESPEEVLAVMRELAREKKGEKDSITYVEAITSPTSSRTIWVAAIDGKVDEKLQEILAEPFDRWRVFLHPRQKDVVEKSYKGPVRVLGGAGTGKTVVAMHRARYLVRHMWKNTDDRILVTTFTQTLANNLREVLSTMCKPEEMERIDVIHIDALAKRILEKALQRNIYIPSEKQMKKIWEDVLEKHGWSEEKYSLIRNEYEKVIQLHGIETWEGYISTTRVGMKKSLSRQERKQIWDTISEVMEQKKKKGWFEFTDVLREARKWLETNPDQPFFRYRAAVVDEAQDFHQEGFKLLRALIPKRENDLFIVGDAHQRIYARQAVLGQCGIHVRGRRSMRLYINYRTTEEIRRKAVEVIKPVHFDDLDGGKDSGKDISLLSGEAPMIRSFPTSTEEKAFVVSEIKKLLEEGVSPNEIAVLVPTNFILDSIMNVLYKHQIPAEKLSANVDASTPKVQCGTIHSSKGLEFRIVFIVEAGEDHLPNRWIVEQKKNDPDDLKTYLQSQRSLLYVAMTRAREKVIITSFGPLTPFLQSREEEQDK